MHFEYSDDIDFSLIEQFVDDNIVDIWKDFEEAKKRKDGKSIGIILRILLEYYKVKVSKRDYFEALAENQKTTDEDVVNRGITVIIIASIIDKPHVFFQIFRLVSQLIIDNNDVRVDIAHALTHMIYQQKYDNFKSLELYQSFLQLREFIKVRFNDELEVQINQKINNFVEYRDANKQRLVYEAILKTLTESNVELIWDYIIAFDGVEEFKDRIEGIKEMYTNYGNSEYKHNDYEDSIETFSLEIAFFISDVVLYSVDLNIDENYILELIKVTEAFHSVLSDIEFDNDEFDKLPKIAEYWDEKNPEISSFIRQHWVIEDEEDLDGDEE